jgi:hypothetical protein
VENPTVLEVQQLMLATPLDASDPRADECTELRWFDPATERGMQHVHTLDGAPSRARAQHLQSGFDLG